MAISYEPLTRDEVIKAVERRGPRRIPLVAARWWGEGLTEQYGDRLQQLERYPEDAERIWIDPMPFDRMGLSWDIAPAKAHDQVCIIDDWAKLDEFIAKLPDPRADAQFAAAIEQAAAARRRGLYTMVAWWRFCFERMWTLRGMTSLFLDYADHPEEVRRLHQAIADHWCRWLDAAHAAFAPDGFWTSDDLGHQTSLMMSPRTFRSLLKPVYRQVGDCLRRNRMHWWLHSCGCNTPVLGDLAECGVTVFHPVQKGTMDERRTAAEFGDRITFLAGIDVQHILQEGSPEDVRREVRFLIDTFDRADGGLCLAAGNGIVGGTPFANIEAFLDEAVRYGAEHRARFAAA
jgi:uroporphyrinogen decarboxylase